MKAWHLELKQESTEGCGFKEIGEILPKASFFEIEFEYWILLLVRVQVLHRTYPPKKKNCSIENGF